MKKRTPHVRIDTRVFDLIPQISANGFVVYAALKKFENRHNGRCYPSYATLADTTGLDRKTVIKYIDLLVEYNLIHKQARFRDGHQTSNQYDLRDYPSAGGGGGTALLPPSGTITLPQDRVELSDGGGGITPPQPLTLEPVTTKKQMECAHKDKISVDGMICCPTCGLSIDTTDQSNNLTAVGESGLNQISDSNSEES